MASDLDPKASDVDTAWSDSDSDYSDSDYDPKYSNLVPACSVKHLVPACPDGKDPSLPLPIKDEIDDDSETRRKNLEEFEAQLIASCPPLFSTIHARRREARNFLKWDVKPWSDYPVAKACTWSSGDNSWSHKSWGETWFGFTWVALQCKDESLCVVVRTSDLLDLERRLVVKYRGRPLYKFPELFWTTLVSNVEDTKEQMLGSSESSNSLQSSFSLVAVAAAGKGQEALTEEMNRAEKTNKFLLETLKSNPSLTSEEAVQTAIMATQYMFGQKFEAEELRVFLWNKEKFIAEELLQKRDNFDLEDPDVDVEDVDLGDILVCLNGV